ncbi:MAG: sodium-dependent transporter [Kiritimatiellae bacterium]|nr:sodium-dependent transporter [Kiritimatiellia bacterium]
MRAKLGSRLGFLMLAAGCAVGLGNVWRFPFIVGQNGGAAFVLVYFLFLAILGFPMLTAELALGRAARQGVSGAMRNLAAERYRRFWAVTGCMIFAGNFLLMIYYTDVSGWLLKYSGDYLRGLPPPEFSALLKDHATCSGYLFLTVAIATAVCALGVKNGVERVTKWMMLALLALLGVLAVKALSLPGAEKGLKFYLSPDWSRFAAHPWKAVFDAMGQAFFTLSTGVGCMAIFGSYVGKEHSLAKESFCIIAIDTFVAFLSGLVIFPACASYNVDVTSGPGLIFIALPNIFADMAGGRLWGFVFFLFLSLGALTTIIAVFECLIGGLMDELAKPRLRLTIAVGCAVAMLALPTVLFEPVLEWEDFIFGQFWLPIGALMICVFVTRKCGWGYEAFSAEASHGEGMRFPSVFAPIMKWVVPLLIILTMVAGLVVH